jgi:hypothetical protein
MKDDPIRVEVAHDRKGVTILMPDDHVEYDIDKAKKFVAVLQEKIKEAEKNEPKAPAPLDLSKSFSGTTAKEAEEFAICSMVHEDEWYCTIGGFELDVEDMCALEAWITKAMKYYRGGGL